MLSNRGLNYPFTAIVGQEKVKKALLTILVDPTISGVLIIGPKGSGKTIIARSIVDLLPEIEIVEGCTFHCNPYKVEEMCNQCKEKITNGEKIEIAKMKMPFVELPISATEDRVVGSIDWEKAIREGVKAFQPGLLAQANRGILYIDQVNILPDSLIDVILDASASGWNVVEREGIKLVHPARFTLIGTINPEEGTLRPQILDRFALCVKMEDITDVERRNTIAIRNMLFEEDPLKFIEEWKGKQIEVKKKIEEARKILPMVKVPREIEEKTVELCIKMNVDGHRPDIIITKVSRVLAALDGRLEVCIDDILSAAELALPHRIKGEEFKQITSEELKQTLALATTVSKAEDKAEETEEEIKQVKVEIGEGMALPQISKPPEIKKKTWNIPMPIALVIMMVMYYFVFYFAFAAVTLMFAGTMGKGWEEVSELMSGELYKWAAIALGGYMLLQTILNALSRRRKIAYVKAVRVQEEEAKRIITHRILVKEQIVEAPPPIQKFGARAFQYISLLGAKILSSYRAAIDKGRKIFQSIYDVMATPPPMFKITLSSEYMKGRKKGRAEVSRGVWIRRGKYVKHALPKEKPYDIAIAPTIRSAAPKQKIRSKRQGVAINIDYDDIRVKVKETRMPLITMIVLDISESMVSSIESVKAAIRGLQKGAHAKRDKIGLIVFKGKHAEVLQYPTTNVNAVVEKLINVGVSDFTPLAAGLKKAREILMMEKSKMKESIPVMVIISDGIANVPLENPLSPENRSRFLNPAQADALDIARLIAKDGIKTIVINTDHRSDEIYKRIYYRRDMQVVFYTPTALMMELAKITRGKYYGLRADKPIAEIVIEDVVSQMLIIPEKAMEPIGFYME
ncbi:MAG: ATP-binding protein [Candidatus Methanomethylicia archaeon]